MPIVNNPKTICILRLSAIGDVCHAVAMVQAIQRQYPEAEITWIIGKVEASLINGLNGVRLIVFDKSQGTAAYLNLRRALKNERFDVLLHMQIALRASLASIFIKAKHRIGFDKQRAKEAQWLFCNHQINAQQHPHVLDGFMAFAQAVGVEDITPKWQLPLAQSDLDFAKAQIPIEQSALIICPAASKAERNWRPERYAQVADYANQQGFVVLLCGGTSKEEALLGANIQACAKADVHNLIGKTTLKQLLALLARAKAVLSPDTGPAHMAVTQGTPVIGLYAHSNPERTGPYFYRDLVVSVYQQHIESQLGSNLNQVPWGKRAKGPNLMDSIEVKSVIDKLSLLIKKE